MPPTGPHLAKAACPPEPETYRFGEFELDLRARLLRRNGHLLAVPAKSMQVLIYLLQHRGRVSSREEMLGALWPGVRATGSLARALGRLRRLLAEQPGGDRMITTLRGRGYRFEAEVTPGAGTIDDRDDSFLQAAAFMTPAWPTPPRAQRLGTLLAGRYLLEESIGRGGVADVFRARHEITGKHVAVKWLRAQSRVDAKAARRFVREARAVGSIDHPNVVSVYDAGTHDGCPFLVMELFHGRSLRSRLREGPPFESREAVAVALGIIDGLRAAHRHGILHRDIKPDNVFLCERPGQPPVPKVLDFGASTVIRSDPELTTLTDHGTIIGTPGYMPLEQMQSSKGLDQRVDVYAVGVVLYEMLTGRRPFPAQTYGELIVKLAVSDPPSADRVRPDLDPELSSIVMTAIARDRSARYSDLTALADALADYPRRSHVARVSTRHWLITLLVATGLLLAVAYRRAS